MISTKYYHQPFHFLIRQCCFLFAGFFVAIIVMRIDTSFWEQYSVALLLLCLLLLMLVLVPGIGRVVNGSRRWVVHKHHGDASGHLVVQHIQRTLVHDVHLRPATQATHSNMSTTHTQQCKGDFCTLKHNGHLQHRRPHIAATAPLPRASTALL